MINSVRITQYGRSNLMRRSILLAIVFGFFCLWALLMTLPLSAQGSATATPSASPTPTLVGQWRVASEFGANLLECVRADCATLAFLPNNTPLEFLGMESGWLHVRTLGGVEGYVPDFLAMEMPTPTSTPTIAPTLTGCTPIEGWVTYVVAPGDTLSGIAARARTTASALVAANCLANADTIFVGQRILVPITIGPPPSTLRVTPPPEVTSPPVRETPVDLTPIVVPTRRGR